MYRNIVAEHYGKYSWLLPCYAPSFLKSLREIDFFVKVILYTINYTVIAIDLRLDNRGWPEHLFELLLIKRWVCSVKKPQVRICHLRLDDYFYTVFLDLSALCLVFVVAKHILAPSLKISYKILMGLRLFRSWQWLWFSFFTCISLAAQLLRPWPSWCCNTSSCSSFDPLFSEFPWSPACEPHTLQLDASVWSCWFCPCSTADLARSSFHSNVCILFIFSLKSALL